MKSFGSKPVKSPTQPCPYLKAWWEKGKPASSKEGGSFSADGRKDWSPKNYGTSYDARRPLRRTRRFHEDAGSEKSVNIGYTWASREGALKRWGDDNNNFNIGSYGAELSSGVSFKKGEAEVNLIKAGVHGEVLSGNLKGSAFNNVLEGSASGKVLSGEAEASIGAEWSKKAKDIHAKVGASADLVKGEVSGQINIPLFGHVLSLGGSAEGQIGASAEAQAGGGWTEKDGFYFGAKAKAGLGLGGGLGFTIGFK